MQTSRFKIAMLTACLEDVLEWMQTGMVNDMHYDDQSMIDSIKDVLENMRSI